MGQQDKCKENSVDCEHCDSRDKGIFCDLPGEALSFINKSKIRNHYKRGQFIFYEGNYPSGVYCVNSGVIRLETEGPFGNGHILRMVQKGGVLGYRSLFADEPYGASAMVHEDAEVCLIPKAALLGLIDKYPLVAVRLLGDISRELRAAEGRFCGMTDKNASERVAEALLFLKENYRDQTWTRKEIGEWASTTPETVMRVLADFESKDLIEQHGRKISLKNKVGLLEVANLS